MPAAGRHATVCPLAQILQPAAGQAGVGRPMHVVSCRFFPLSGGAPDAGLVSVFTPAHHGPACHLTAHDCISQAGLKMREAALEAALDEMVAWLETSSSQVAIFDATNSTEARRQTLVRAGVSPATSICLQSGFCSGPVSPEACPYATASGKQFLLWLLDAAWGKTRHTLQPLSSRNPSLAALILPLEC